MTEDAPTTVSEKTNNQISMLQWGLALWVLAGPAFLALALTVGTETQTSFYSGAVTQGFHGGGKFLLFLSVSSFVGGMVMFLMGLGYVIRVHLAQQKSLVASIQKAVTQ